MMFRRTSTGCQRCDTIYLDMHYILTHISRIPKPESEAIASMLASSTLASMSLKLLSSTGLYFLI